MGFPVFDWVPQELETLAQLFSRQSQCQAGARQLRLRLTSKEGAFR